MEIMTKRRVAGLATTSAMIAAMAVAALPGATFAAAPRQCDTMVPVPVEKTTATFTATQPAGAYDQWGNLWTHNYTVTVKTDGSFAGTGTQSGNDGQVTMNNVPETITGKFLDIDNNGTSDQVTYAVTRNDGATWTLTNAPTDGTTITDAVILDSNNQPVATPDAVEFKVTQPALLVVIENGVADFANHGEYVSAMGGGATAAQKCVGMPIVSKAAKTPVK
jgi:hypothetical protein